MSGISVVEMATALLERSRGRQSGQERMQMSSEVSKVLGNADGSAESVQQSTGWLQSAQNRVRLRYFLETGKI